MLQKDSCKTSCINLPSLEDHGGIHMFLTHMLCFEIQAQNFRRIITTPAVSHIHRVEGRNMHAFLETYTLHPALRITFQYITYPFRPRRIRHLGDYRLQLFIFIKTVITGDRINNETKIPEICKHTDRPLVPLARFFENTISYCFV